MARGCESLKDNNNRILDIALEYGFDSHETFTRAFKDAYGMTPVQYRQNPVFLNQFDKPDLLLSYAKIDEGVPLISEGLVLEIIRTTLAEPIHFMGLLDYIPIAAQFPVGESTGVDKPGELWKQFHQVKGSIPRIPKGRELGVSFLGDAPVGYFSYFTGAEIEAEAIDPRFAAWLLPAGAYIVCGFEAENFHTLTTVALNKAIRFTNDWLKHHNLTADMFAPEVYYDSTPESTYMEFWVPVIQ